MRMFHETFRELEAGIRAIVAEVQRTPVADRPGTLHIDRLSAIVPYAYYVALVRQQVRDPQAVIVDWGGQHGQVTRLLAHYYPRTICYALRGDWYDTRYALPEWHQRLGVRNVVWGTNPRRINLPDASADVVISSGVLEHVHEAGVREQEALADIHRVLKPGGMLIVWNLPHQYGSGELLYALARRPHHDRRFTRSSIGRLMQDAGFTVDSIERHEFLPGKAREWLSRLAPADAVFSFDHHLSRVPPLSLFAQHMTVVARSAAMRATQ